MCLEHSFPGIVFSRSQNDFFKNRLNDESQASQGGIGVRHVSLSKKKGSSLHRPAETTSFLGHTMSCFTNTLVISAIVLFCCAVCFSTLILSHTGQVSVRDNKKVENYMFG